MKLSAATRKYAFFAFLAGIFVALLCVIFHPFELRQQELEYQGKKLADWAREIDRSDFFRLPAYQQRPKQNAEAIAAIRHIGTNALPVVLDLLTAKDSWFKMKLEEWAQWYNYHDWPNQRRHPIYIKSAGEKQFAGVNIIWALGDKAKPIVPDLIQLLQSKDGEVAEDAMLALPGVGTNAILPLIELLNDPNEDIQTRAATSLGYFGRQTNSVVCAPMIVPVFVRRVEVKTNNIYFWALGNFGTNATSAIPILLNILKSKSSWAPPKPAALGALNRINPQMAVPFIKQWQNDLTNTLDFVHATNPPTEHL